MRRAALLGLGRRGCYDAGMTAPALPGDNAPFAVRWLDVGKGHRLYVEEVGTPGGLPALFLHGGPGSGCRPSQRALFDPGRFRAVLFDQRGAGRSKATNRLHANTTAHLLADIERIRAELGIDRWLVVGGSWGATLALAYAERHPERVSGLVLRAVFLGTRAELDWAFVDGPRRLRPDLFAEFLAFLPDEERADPLRAYWRRILDPDPDIHGPAAWAWHDAERVLSETAPARSGFAAHPAGTTDFPATPFFEAHYFSRDCFLPPGAILAGASRLAGIPGLIVQGRYDLLCPPATSFALAAKWREARVRIVEGAGHAMTEPGIMAAMAESIVAISA